ncbi:Cu2+-exporting ATPase [Capronia epimyces CBS 606.96]|uniref:Cu2+-exporting ATPase n=1 Tax=Capronia epimyces CBS 606.96 TaxID=1182542 RepID=W9YUZ5_9EURO|nr:Cu2+-exporting ATPase [Capronia epimyces CBS 606.96]EXJ93086.1 Cu2+-exporting ATPase [Capronia epimyces CBS 606.96]
MESHRRLFDESTNKNSRFLGDQAQSRACDEHISSARHKYRAVEGIMKCVCRTLKAKNLESCCRPHKRNAPKGPDTIYETEAKCGGKTACACIDDENEITVAKVPLSCSPAAAARPGESRPQGCKPQSKTNLKPACEVSQAVTDVEKGEAHLEHVELTVNGMDCSGCEASLSRALATFPEIHHLQISVILARAAFDLDTSRLSADQVIAYIGRATKFTCEKVSRKSRQIEVIHPRGSKSLVQQARPIGIVDVRAVTETTALVEYDPALVGARALLDRSFDVPLTLAPARPAESVEAGKKQVRRDGLITLGSSILTIPVLVLAWAPLPENPVTYGSVSLALATIIQVCIAGPFYPVAFKDLVFFRLIGVELLIVLSTSAAYLFSVIAFAYQMKGEPLSTGAFFAASTLIVSLIMLGRFISAWARQRAAESISVRTLQVPIAVLLDDKSTSEREIDARLLQYRDVFKVGPHSRIVTDGTVIRGHSEVDESMVTGESRPVAKGAGSPVVAGSMNGPGILHVHLRCLPGDNTVSAIADMVDEAKMSKAQTQEIADRVAGYFVPVVVGITIITFVGWIGYGIGKRGYSGSEAVENAVTYAIAVLIVSCPCAIGLCVPMVIAIAGGVAAKHGVIFKTGQTIEIARKTNHVVFDKTGTLTEGVLSVVEEIFPEGEEMSIKPLILGLVGNVKHPVSAAVARSLKSQGVCPAQVDKVKMLVGKGLQGTSQGSKIAAGNCRWLGLQHSAIRDLASRGLTVFCVVIDTHLRAVFGLEDSIREDSQGVIGELRTRNIAVSLVSGDDDGPVQRVASRLGIPQSHVRSECSPRDKLEYLRDIMRDGQAVVMFCGDGTNDAPALAQANIGIHVNEGEGSEVAQSAADAILVRPYLGGILSLIDLSRAAFRRIMLNFCWSFTYNLFAVLLAAGLFVRWRIPPQYAALGELVSVLPVIGIALLLRYIKL